MTREGAHGVERLAAECPRGLSADEHDRRTVIHVVGPDRRVLCLDRIAKRRSLERTDAQVMADHEFRGEVEAAEARPEGAGFFAGLEAMGFPRSRALELFARQISRQRK